MRSVLYSFSESSVSFFFTFIISTESEEVASRWKLLPSSYDCELSTKRKRFKLLGFSRRDSLLPSSRLLSSLVISSATGLRVGDCITELSAELF